MSVVKIDGVEYALDSLSDDAKGQIASIQVVDRRVQDLREQMSILQTARYSYVAALKTLLADAETPATESIEAQAAEGETAIN